MVICLRPRRHVCVLYFCARKIKTMNKKSKTIKTFALVLALGAALLLPASLDAQNSINNQTYGGSSGGTPIGNQTFGSSSDHGGVGNQTFGSWTDGGAFGTQAFGSWTDGGAFGTQVFGCWTDPAFGNQVFGYYHDGVTFGLQTFGGYSEGGGFGNQTFGQENAPLTNGLSILLLAGAGYAFTKRKRNKK